MRGLVPNSRETHKFDSRARHLAFELSIYHLRCSDDMACLIFEKGYGRNFFLEYRRLRACKIMSRLVFLEERQSDSIYNLVSALCRHDDRNKELKRGRMYEFAFGFRIRLLKIRDYSFGAEAALSYFRFRHSAIEGRRGLLRHGLQASRSRISS